MDASPQKTMHPTDLGRARRIIKDIRLETRGRGLQGYVFKITLQDIFGGRHRLLGEASNYKKLFLSKDSPGMLSPLQLIAGLGHYLEIVKSKKYRTYA